jgi:hypothetical protein
MFDEILCFPALCGTIQGASKTTYKKNALHFVAEVKGGSTETMEVSMLISSTSKRIAPFGLFGNNLFVIPHNHLDGAFQTGGAA